MGDFDGELSIEVVRGVRVWGVDSRGRLRGVTHDDIWRPGENIAVCHAQRPAYKLELDEEAYAAAKEAYEVKLEEFENATRTWKRRTMGVAPEPPEFPRASDFRTIASQPPEHDYVVCHCGFWAHYDPDPTYSSTTRVMGVIEGYGKTTIGTEGFRAQKARILALYFPEAETEWTELRNMKIRRNYKDIPVFNSLVAMVTEFPPTDGAQDEDFWVTPPKKVEDDSTWAQAQGRILRGYGGGAASSAALRSLYFGGGF